MTENRYFENWRIGRRRETEGDEFDLRESSDAANRFMQALAAEEKKVEASEPNQSQVFQSTSFSRSLARDTQNAVETQSLSLVVPKSTEREPANGNLLSFPLTKTATGTDAAGTTRAQGELPRIQSLHVEPFSETGRTKPQIIAPSLLPQLRSAGAASVESPATGVDKKTTVLDVSKDVTPTAGRRAATPTDSPRPAEAGNADDKGNGRHHFCADLKAFWHKLFTREPDGQAVTGRAPSKADGSDFVSLAGSNRQSPPDAGALLNFSRGPKAPDISLDPPVRTGLSASSSFPRVESATRIGDQNVSPLSVVLQPVPLEFSRFQTLYPPESAAAKQGVSTQGVSIATGAFGAATSGEATRGAATSGEAARGAATMGLTRAAEIAKAPTTGDLSKTRIDANGSMPGLTKSVTGERANNSILPEINPPSSGPRAERLPSTTPGGTATGDTGTTPFPAPRNSSVARSDAKGAESPSSPDRPILAPILRQPASTDHPAASIDRPTSSSERPIILPNRPADQPARPAQQQQPQVKTNPGDLIPEAKRPAAGFFPRVERPEGSPLRSAVPGSPTNQGTAPGSPEATVIRRSPIVIAANDRTEAPNMGPEKPGKDAGGVKVPGAETPITNIPTNGPLAPKDGATTAKVQPTGEAIAAGALNNGAQLPFSRRPFTDQTDIQTNATGSPGTRWDTPSNLRPIERLSPGTSLTVSTSTPEKRPWKETDLGKVPLVSKQEPVKTEPAQAARFDSSDSKAVERKASEAPIVDPKAGDRKAPDFKAVDQKPTEAKGTIAKATDSKAVDANPVKANPVNAKPVDAKTLDATTENKGVVAKSTDPKIADSKIRDPKVIDSKSAEPKAVDVRTIDAKTAKPVTANGPEVKAADAKTIETRATATKAVEQKVAEGKAAEGKAAEGKAAEQKTSEPKSAQNKPVDAKVSEPKIVDAKAPDLKSPGIKAPEQKANDGKAPEQKSSELKPSDAKSGDHKAADAKAPEAKAGEPKATGLKQSEQKTGDTKAPSHKPADTKSPDPKSPDSKPGDTKSADAKQADLKPAEIKSADQKTIEGKTATAKGADAKLPESKQTDSKGAEIKGSEINGTVKGTDHKGTDVKVAEVKVGENKVSNDAKGAEPKGTAPKGTVTRGNDVKGTDGRVTDNKVVVNATNEVKPSDGKSPVGKSSDAKADDTKAPEPKRGEGKSDKTEKSDKSDKSERAEKTDKATRCDKAEKTDKPERKVGAADGKAPDKTVVATDKSNKDAKEINRVQDTEENRTDKNNQNGKKKDIDQAIEIAPLVVVQPAGRKPVSKPEKKVDKTDKSEKTRKGRPQLTQRRVKYTVRKGDTLESIGELELKDSRYANLILTINRGTIAIRFINGRQEPLLRVGQVLWLPTESEREVYARAIFSTKRPRAQVRRSAAASTEPVARAEADANSQSAEPEEIKLPEVELMNPSDSEAPQMVPSEGAAVKPVPTVQQLRKANQMPGVTLHEIDYHLGQTRLLNKLNSMAERVSVSTSVWLPVENGFGPNVQSASHVVPAGAATDQAIKGPQTQEPKFFDEQSGIQTAIDKLAETCRVVTTRTGSTDANNFNAALQVRLDGTWTTIAWYEYKFGHGYRYQSNGGARPFPMDLPLTVVLEMAREDFQRNWSTYCRDFCKRAAQTASNT